MSTGIGRPPGRPNVYWNWKATPNTAAIVMLAGDLPRQIVFVGDDRIPRLRPQLKVA
ncbi:hypothetical protein RHGRI_010446 [Rhododendron griersonianum]|uniref:Uncharacterized protein n=1 Tax=Rhododendron griersonianum TaxID=479676 RepID=A0AAV6KII9_9ERIC|nr:hypothetical protein RHGRI_010446 [Rhododendron griersonianum]